MVTPSFQKKNPAWIRPEALGVVLGMHFTQANNSDERGETSEVMVARKECYLRAC